MILALRDMLDVLLIHISLEEHSHTVALRTIAPRLYLRSAMPLNYVRSNII